MISNEKIKVFGIRRSGNHAIINWIINKTNGLLIHFNDCHCSNNFTADRNIFVYKNAKLEYSIIRLPEFSSQNAKNENKIKSCLKYDYSILSYENKHPNVITHDNIEANNTYKILIIRDPFNLLASIFMHKKLNISINEFKNIYKIYYNLYIEDNEFIKINYNKWFTSIDYRNKISKNLHLPNTPDNLNTVSNHGGGSSFDGQTFNGSQNQMDVLNRYKKFNNNDKFKSYFNDDIFELSKKTFDIKGFI